MTKRQDRPIANLQEDQVNQLNTQIKSKKPQSQH